MSVGEVHEPKVRVVSAKKKKMWFHYYFVQLCLKKTYKITEFFPGVVSAPDGTIYLVDVNDTR